MVWLGLVWFGLAKSAETALARPHMGENAQKFIIFDVLPSP